MNDDGLSKSDIVVKLLSFGVNGMNVFQVKFTSFHCFCFHSLLFLRFEVFCCCWILYLSFVNFFDSYITHYFFLYCGCHLMSLLVGSEK